MMDAGETALGHFSNHCQIKVVRLEILAGRCSDLFRSGPGQSVTDCFNRKASAITQNLLSEPDHVVFRVFQVKIQLTDQIIPRLSQFLAAGFLFFEFVERLMNQRESLFDVRCIDPCGNGQKTRVMKISQIAVDRISQTVVFPKPLKKSRTHIFPQHGV